MSTIKFIAKYQCKTTLLYVSSIVAERGYEQCFYTVYKSIFRILPGPGREDEGFVVKKVIVFAAVTAAVLFCTGCVNPLWPDYVKGSGDGSGRSSGSVVSGPDLREMVRIKGGYVPFYDGSGYKTKVPDFLIGKYEITQDFFESVIANGGDSITGG